MNKYREVARVLFKAQLAWRFDIALNMIFTVSKILLAVVLWGVVFKERQLVSGFTFDAMLTYYIISSFLSQLEMSEGAAGEISARIRNGTFSKYMTIPVNVFGYFGAQTVGAAAFYLSFNLLAAILWVLVFGIKLVITSSLAVIPAAVLICLLGLVFMIQMNCYLGILTFKFQDIGLFLMIRSSLIQFATGTLIPLVLLPAIVLDIMRFLPFYYVTYLPSMLLIGRNADEIAIGIFVLSAWNIFFLVLNRLTYKRLRVKYDGVGI